MKLVIVESPTKAKTISKFLDKSFKTDSSYGHVRDLPKSKIGIDTEKNFEPQYIIFKANQKRLTALKKVAQKADTVYYATDEDREGEAIAWHLSEIFKLPKERERRIAFHEITKEAILEALEKPRQIDMDLVNAQQARRVLDRLVGYKLSPFLWKKITRGLSAGRVQSVAVRLIVEREREIEKFQKEEYWSVEADFKKAEADFHAKLYKIEDKPVDKMQIKDEIEAKKVLDGLKSALYNIVGVEKQEGKKHPMPPFRTATLQQEANRRLGFSAKQTMMIAQQLYEGVKIGSDQVGLITYMRTDSLNLSGKFLADAANFIKDNFGADYSTFREFKTKNKGAQEAHEAIRPADVFRTPEEIKEHLTPQQYKLYNLVWRRAVACQMAPAVVDKTNIDVNDNKNIYTFRASGQTIRFDGYLKVYFKEKEDVILPEVKEGEMVDLIKIEPLQHFTQPPARYSDATLVKVLEEKGIGRPSTYAPTIATVIERHYVEKEERRLKPTELAFLVNDLLVEHFPKIVDYDFTAEMEEKLDEVAEGKLKWQPVIADFYKPFEDNLKNKYEEVKKEDLITETTNEICEKCGLPMTVKQGRYGKFLACSGYPECKNTKQLGKDGQAEPEERLDENCPTCGKPMVYRQGRYGRFIACSDYPTCKTTKQVLKEVGVKCPECEQGDIVERHGKRKTFYGCSRYPDCKFSTWQRPTGEKCAKCGSLMVWQKKDVAGCSNKECETNKKIKEDVA